VCRSVLAERLAARLLADQPARAGGRFAVASAGTIAMDGLAPHPYTVLTLSQYGISADGPASRALTAGQVTAASLVLTAGREHRDEVVALVPAASRRTFLLREFARLSPYAEPGGVARGPQAGRAVVAAVASLRGRTPYVDPAADEIADPPATVEAFARCAAIVAEDVQAVIGTLTGYGPRGLAAGPALAAPAPAAPGRGSGREQRPGKGRSWHRWNR